MRNHMMSRLGLMRVALVAGVIMVPGLAAQAGSVDIFSDGANSTEGLGEFTGTLDYAFDADADLGLLTVTLTNTSDPDNGGFLTGFLYNIVSDDSEASATLVSASHPYEETRLEAWIYSRTARTAPKDWASSPARWIMHSMRTRTWVCLPLL